MDPGQLNKKVLILAPTLTYGSNGEPINTFGNYGYRWMKIEPLTGDENIMIDADMAISNAKFTMRYNSDIDEEYRFSWNSQIWDIENISIIGKNQWMECICKTTTPLSGDDSSYGDYYATNSLRLRVITGVTKAGQTPTQAEVNTAVGLTAVQAGSGYMVYIEFTTGDYYGMFISNGSVWRRVLYGGFS